MYEKLLKDIQSYYPDFPCEPSLELGMAIKQVRLRMGMTQNELARNSKIKPAALKTLENGYARFTKNSNLEAIARVLRTTPREIVLEAREWFPGNFFVLKQEQTDHGTGHRKKHRAEIWFKTKTTFYDGWRISFISPPPLAPFSFCFAMIEIDPRKDIKGMRLKLPSQIAGFVERGSMKISYEGREYDIFGNQGFSFRGDKPHALINPDPDNPLRLFLAFSCQSRTNPVLPKNSHEGQLNIGYAIRRLRHRYSNAKSKPLSFYELSCLTGLGESSLRYLEGTTDGDQVIYWDKIEKIVRALKISFSQFLDLAEGKDPGYFYLATAHDRALIDYRHYLGVRIKSAVFPGTHNQFHISEIYIEPKGGIRRVSWKRKDEALIAAYAEDGEMRVEAGKNRKAFLHTGESVYFDGGLGYIFTNTGTKPAKLIMASRPPIIF